MTDNEHLRGGENMSIDLTETLENHRPDGREGWGRLS